MSGNQIDEEKTLGLLRQVGASWKGAITAMAATVVFLVFYFYGLNIVTYPWAYGLTSQTPQGNWIGKITIDKNTTFLVNMKMAHDTEFSETKAKTIPSIAGLISICSAKTAPIDARIYGNPAWTGSTVVLGTKIDFGRNIVPEKYSAKPARICWNALLTLNIPSARRHKRCGKTSRMFTRQKPSSHQKSLCPFLRSVLGINHLVSNASPKAHIIYGPAFNAVLTRTILASATAGLGERFSSARA